MEHIGQKIKDLRKKADMTQVWLAEVVGVTAQAVSIWEVGQASPILRMETMNRSGRENGWSKKS